MPLVRQELPRRKKGGFFRSHIKNEVRRAIGIFRVDGKTSLRALQDCVQKVLYVDVSLGFIYKELARASQIAEKINLKISSLVDLSHCVMDEVWIKVAKTGEAWNFGFLTASPKSLFIGFFTYMAKRDEVSMGIKVLEHKQKGFNPSILISDLLPTYRAIAGYFSVCLHQPCTNHARCIISRIIKNLPSEAKKDKLFYNYMLRIKKRFNALYSLQDVGEINSSIAQIKRELKLFYIQERREWAQSMLSFIERNSRGLFLYKRLPKEKIEHTNNAAEIIFSLFKPQYKMMKEFRIPNGTQAHFNLFTLRHNFRAFPRGKRKGFSPVQLEGLNVSLNDWSELLYSGDRTIQEESLFFSGKGKETIFQE
ncbi:MAG: hypothetical protein U9O41_06415 [Candidatus Aerophobetes bacterium]|nr:hypothetical protein [Candidatus Aerophobetes bacterium]